jgi:hypothetical protein
MEARAVMPTVTPVSASRPHDLRIIVFRDTDGSWVAQCLEVDIVAQGADVESAKEQLYTSVLGELAVSEEPLDLMVRRIGPAPDDFHELYKRASGAPTSVLLDSDGSQFKVDCVVAAPA